MKTAEFDYELPESLIAQHPVEPRDRSRLMVVRRETEEIEHRTFRDIVDYLRPGDGLVVNRTRVIPARLKGVRADTGGRVEVVLIREIEPGLWEALLSAGSRLRPGMALSLEEGAVSVTVAGGPDPTRRYVRFAEETDVAGVLQRMGRIPLPLYIRREPTPEDATHYQTVYADVPGAVAAPTAGLHFTNTLLDRIRAHGVMVIPILLHVGPGTFRPVHTDEIEAHTMEAEYYRVDQAAAAQIAAAHRNGRVIAVGTTTVRTLETVAAALIADAERGAVRTYEGWTERFIHPPYRFRIVHVLLTNFHLPRSTLLMLVCAFAGRELTLRAYREAVRARYRFYSYGDAMLII